ncbi:MAG: GNAT family N-acetyltransferase [Bacteroidia bacterium]|nr:GNAT family N-acetyltransferase [Bacteroidia bacterium]
MEITFQIPQTGDLTREEYELLVNLIVKVYEETEADLFKTQIPRTSLEELQELVAEKQFIVARIGQGIVGGCYLRRRNDEEAEFGMLATLPELQGQGIGRRIIEFAGSESRKNGFKYLLADVLYPADGSSHPYKDFLLSWYGKLGFNYHRELTFEAKYEKVKGMMARPCKMIILRKTL